MQLLSSLTATRYQAVGKALRECGAKVKEPSGGQWRFTLGNGTSLRTSARMNEGWLLIDADLGSGRGKQRPLCAERLWDLLQLNGALRGGAKFVLQGDRLLRLRAEIPVEEGIDVAGRVREACAGLKAAADRFRRRKTRKPSWTAVARPPGDAPDVDLQQLCTEAGWPFAERSGGRLSVELDVPDGFYQATVEEQERGCVRVWTDLASWEADALAARCRRAAGALLLTASAIVRMARATTEESDGRTRAQFDVVFSGTPCAGELAHALSALSVACRLCGKEAKALQDEVVAREYLAARGWSS